MDFNSTSLESVLNRLSTVLEGMGDGYLEHPAIPYNINQLLETAIDNRAAMLHINVGSPPMLRINDQLVPIGEHQLTRGDCQKLLYPLLTREQREVLYSGVEVDGCFPSSGTGFRLNVYKERGNISASIRRLRSDIPSLDSLGMSSQALEKILQEQSGLVLLTGAPRSGKLNTLVAMIGHLNANRNARIISLEKPIQFWHQKSLSTVVQREIGIDTKSFAHAVQQAVLQDPDIIALTDIPDRETAEFVIRAAVGGHLVLAAIDASSSVRVLERLIKTFASSEFGPKVIAALANSLRAVICQTLILRPESNASLPVFEIMTNSEAIHRELLNGETERLFSIMRSENMQTLGKALGSLVTAGTISRELALEYVSSPEDLIISAGPTMSVHSEPKVSSTKPVKKEEKEDDDEVAPIPTIPDATDNPLVAWL